MLSQGISFAPFGMWARYGSEQGAERGGVSQEVHLTFDIGGAMSVELVPRTCEVSPELHLEYIRHSKEEEHHHTIVDFGGTGEHVVFRNGPRWFANLVGEKRDENEMENLEKLQAQAQML